MEKEHGETFQMTDLNISSWNRDKVQMVEFLLPVSNQMQNYYTKQISHISPHKKKKKIIINKGQISIQFHASEDHYLVSCISN